MDLVLRQRGGSLLHYDDVGARGADRVGDTGVPVILQADAGSRHGRHRDRVSGRLRHSRHQAGQVVGVGEGVADEEDGELGVTVQRCGVVTAGGDAAERQKPGGQQYRTHFDALHRTADFGPWTGPVSLVLTPRPIIR